MVGNLIENPDSMTFNDIDIFKPGRLTKMDNVEIGDIKDYYIKKTINDQTAYFIDPKRLLMFLTENPQKIDAFNKILDSNIIKKIENFRRLIEIQAITYYEKSKQEARRLAIKNILRKKDKDLSVILNELKRITDCINETIQKRIEYEGTYDFLLENGVRVSIDINRELSYLRTYYETYKSLDKIEISSFRKDLIQIKLPLLRFFFNGWKYPAYIYLRAINYLYYSFITDELLTLILYRYIESVRRGELVPSQSRYVLSRVLYFDLKKMTWALSRVIKQKRIAFENPDLTVSTLKKIYKPLEGPGAKTISDNLSKLKDKSKNITLTFVYDNTDMYTLKKCSQCKLFKNDICKEIIRLNI